MNLHSAMMTVCPYLPRSGILSRSNSSLFSTLQGVKDQEGCWRPRRDLNPCYRRESTMSDRKLLKRRNTDGYQKQFQHRPWE
jgi:hypothetical protein